MASDSTSPGPDTAGSTPRHTPAGKARNTSRELCGVILHPLHLRRTCLVALLVGIWLTAFNEGAQLLSGPWNVPLAIKIAMNLLTPFVVANLGLLSRRGEPPVGVAAPGALAASLGMQRSDQRAGNGTPP